MKIDETKATDRFFEFVEELELKNDAEIAKAMDIGDKHMISRLRRGKKNISIPIMLTMARKWNVNTDYILTGRLPRYVENENDNDTKPVTKFENKFDEAFEIYWAAKGVNRMQMLKYALKRILRKIDKKGGI